MATTNKPASASRMLADAHDRAAAAARALEDSKNKVARAVSIRNSDRTELEAANRSLENMQRAFADETAAAEAAATAPASTSPANEYVVYLRDHRDINVTADVASHELVGNRTMLVFTIEGETAHVAEFDLNSVVGLHRSPITEK